MKKRHRKNKKSKYNKSEAISRVRMMTNYGPFKKGQDYKVLSSGRDWVRSTCGGKPYFIPLDFVETNPVIYQETEEDFDYEQYEDMF